LTKGKGITKFASLVLSVALSAAFLGGCGSAAPRVYKESQFNSRLQYLRFCQQLELQTGRCE
jgi:hypothetical protein